MPIYEYLGVISYLLFYYPSFKMHSCFLIPGLVRINNNFEGLYEPRQNFSIHIDRKILRVLHWP